MSVTLEAGAGGTENVRAGTQRGSLSKTGPGRFGVMFDSFKRCGCSPCMMHAHVRYLPAQWVRATGLPASSSCIPFACANWQSLVLHCIGSSRNKSLACSSVWPIAEGSFCVQTSSHFIKMSFGVACLDCIRYIMHQDVPFLQLEQTIVVLLMVQSRKVTHSFYYLE